MTNGIKGKRNLERLIDPKDVSERFILEFKFTSFQKDAIKLIYDMRIMSTSQISRALDKGIEYVRKQLLVLYKNGFLYRRYESEGIGVGSSAAYWMLDRGGALFIAGCYEISVKKLNWDIRSNLIRFEKLAHAVQISEVMTELREFARVNGHSVESSYCDRHLYYDFTANGEKVGICPDLFITYNTGSKIYQFFFEIDMGTMAITGPISRTSVVINKIPKYEKFAVSKEWKQYFDVYPRIVFLTTTKTRVLTMVNAIKEVRNSSLDFLVSTFDLFKEAALEDIFKRVSDNEATNLFE